MRRPRWLTLWTDHSGRFQYRGLDEGERRELVLTSLERSGYGWQIVLVAGFGFLADAYDIFSINTILPMISIVYWQNEFPDRFRLGLNLSTLLGSMVGQVVLGYLADRIGRRKVYGLELAFTIVASLAFATASSGAFNSMSLIGILIFWRLIMGIGIGSDYPLSAVLTAEFAPSKHRDSMLASVFFFQPLGQFVAVLIAFATTAGWKSQIESVIAAQGSSSCTIAATTSVGIECARALDRSWRLIAGLGAVPAAIAIYFRFTIPESVYYTLDVKEDSARALKDANRYYGSTPSLESQSVNSDHEDAEEGSAPGDENLIAAPKFVKHNDSNLQTDGIQPTDHSMQANAEDGSPMGGSFIYRPGAESLETKSGTVAKDCLPNGSSSARGHPNIPTEHGTDSVGQQGFHSQFITYLSSDCNWKDLLSTSLNWMLLDFTFYLLGVNSSSFVPTLFGQKDDPKRPPYSLLVNQERHIMESSSIGSLVGSLLSIAIFNVHIKNRLPKGVNSPRKLQIWGFGVLSVLFIVVGSLYITLPSTGAVGAIVTFYALCQLFYNLGPNTTTFMIPAQVFPTRFRCFCYGISAAFGKLGSVLGQIVVTEVTSDTGLGATLIGFTLLTFVGAILSATISPETCEAGIGNSLPLTNTAYRAKRQRLAFPAGTAGHEKIDLESRKTADGIGT